MGSIKQQTLADRPVGAIGYGLMRLTWRQSGLPSQAESFSAMDAALECGANFWNVGELYGTAERNSCHLLNEYFSQYPERAEKIVLSVKGGLIPGTLTPDGTEKNIRRSVDECLRLLDGKIPIDIFQAARVDPNVPIEDTIRVLAELVKEGKIRTIGLSEVTAEQIERAASVHPIAAVEVELSLWTLDVLYNGVAAACAKLGIPIVAYSPLGLGSLTGNAIKRNADIPKDDWRRFLPKFQDDVLESNNKRTEALGRLAARKGALVTQIAIAWVQSLSGRTITTPDGPLTLGPVIPIPGASSRDRVIENFGAFDVDLSEADLAEVDEILRAYPIQGERH